MQISRVCDEVNLSFIISCLTDGTYLADIGLSSDPIAIHSSLSVPLVGGISVVDVAMDVKPENGSGLAA